MKKIFKSIIRNKYILLSCLSGLIVITSVFILQKVTPFGNNSLLKIDFYHQYGPMLAELYNRVRHGKNLIYSFNVGLGIPYFRNYFNYLSSPINIIMFLFKHKHLLTSFSFIIGIKSILSCITCSYYLRKKFDTNKLYMIGLSVLYAYSAYFTAYYWNIMWIDGLYVLPILTLGIEKLINKNNGLLYTLSLIYMLYTNYFIGYMLCIYSCIYFISYSIIKFDKKKIFKTITKFTICSLIAGLALAFELIPMYEALTSTNATMGSIPSSQYYSFTILEFFKNHLTGVNSTVLASDISNAPNISCGILIISLFFLFIINKDINLKRKIVYISILVFMLLSFYIAQIDYIWHAFHVPNDLPYRYSFIYSFVLIIIASYVLNTIKKASLNRILLSYLLSLIFITFVYISKYNNITDNMITINYLLITVYLLIYLIYYYYPKLKIITSILFVGICVLESTICINHNWKISQNIDNYYMNYDSITDIIKKINDKDLFYRIEKNDNLTFNDPAWYNYYGQETFSSMSYYNLSKLNFELGMPGNEINSYYYKNNTPVYNLMFNIKYIIGNNTDTKRYNLYLEKDNIKMYKYKYTTGLMFKVNDTISSWNNIEYNPIEYQNDFILKSTNIENVFYKIKEKNRNIIFESDEETIIKYTFENPSDSIFTYINNLDINYIVLNNKIYYKGTLDINDIRLKLNTDILDYYSYNEPFIISDSMNNTNIDVYVSYKTKYYEKINIYSIDNNRFVNAYDYLKTNEIKITKFSENTIKGKIQLKENSTIYTSIPYDKGWKVYCNGKRIQTIRINDALLGFYLPEGQNTIKLIYTPNNIDIGISISISTIIFSITYLLVKRKKSSRQD